MTFTTKQILAGATIAEVVAALRLNSEGSNPMSSLVAVSGCCIQPVNQGKKSKGAGGVGQQHGLATTGGAQQDSTQDDSYEVMDVGYLLTMDWKDVQAMPAPAELGAKPAEDKRFDTNCGVRVVKTDIDALVDRQGNRPESESYKFPSRDHDWLRTTIRNLQLEEPLRQYAKDKIGASDNVEFFVLQQSSRNLTKTESGTGKKRQFSEWHGDLVFPWWEDAEAVPLCSENGLGFKSAFLGHLNPTEGEKFPFSEAAFQNWYQNVGPTSCGSTFLILNVWVSLSEAKDTETCPLVFYDTSNDQALHPLNKSPKSGFATLQGKCGTHPSGVGTGMLKEGPRDSKHCFAHKKMGRGDAYIFPTTYVRNFENELVHYPAIHAAWNKKGLEQLRRRSVEFRIVLKVQPSKK